MNVRNLILHNFVWKLISVMLAALVWWQVTPLVEANKRRIDAARTLIVTREFTLNVRVMTSAREPRGYAVTPGEVRVAVRAQAALLDSLNRDALQAYVDATVLREARGAPAEVIVNTPDDVTLVKVSPHQVYVARL